MGKNTYIYFAIIYSLIISIFLILNRGSEDIENIKNDLARLQNQYYDHLRICEKDE